jgi:adenosine deaminase
MNVAEKLRAMPKTELHLHLEGSIDAATAIELAGKHDVTFPSATTPENLYRFDNLADFLVIYSLVAASVLDVDDFARITRECLTRCAGSGVRYTEMFFSPEAHLVHGVEYTTMLDGILAGAAEAKTDHGIECRLIPAINRELGAQRAVSFVEMVIEHRRDEVIGIGLDFNEVGFPAEDYVEAFALAKVNRLHRTSHAGEVGPATNIANGIELLDCERVDHGYNIVDDPELLAKCRESQIPFTVCPSTTTHTTNFRDLSDPDHAIRKMADAGLFLMVNSDDPPVFDTDLTNEFLLLHDLAGFSLEELGEFAKNSIDTAWVDDSTKRQWHAEWDPEIDRIIAE